MTKATDKEIVEWQFKYLREVASDLSPNDLEWLIKMEEAFQNQGELRGKQFKILEDIYKRY